MKLVKAKCIEQERYQPDRKILLQTLLILFSNSKRGSHLTIMEEFLNEANYWINAIGAKKKEVGELLSLLDTRP